MYNITVSIHYSITLVRIKRKSTDEHEQKKKLHGITIYRRKINFKFIRNLSLKEYNLTNSRELEPSYRDQNSKINLLRGVREEFNQKNNSNNSKKPTFRRINNVLELFN